MSEKRMGRRWAAGVALSFFAAGCATTPPLLAPTSTPSAVRSLPRVMLPTFQGSTHTVQPGETLWRIAQSYGLTATMLARANHLSTTHHLRVGQPLFVPLPVESGRFVWPLRGRWRSTGSSSVEITAQPGSLVRASRSGRVAVAAHRLPGFGKVVVLDHLNGYFTVYAGLGQLLVSPGEALRQGMPLGTLGSQALHFEIREGARPKDALALLPAG